MSRFAVIPAALFDDARVDHHLLAVYGALALFTDEKGYCWPSLDTLAGKLRLSRASVSRYVAQLVELGYVERTYRKDQSSLYVLVVQWRQHAGEGVTPVQPGVSPVQRGVPPVQPAVAPVETNNTKNNTIEHTKKGRRLSEDWEPATDDLLWAGREHPRVDLARETELFRNHWLDSTSPNAVKRGWSRAWRNWIIKAEKDYTNVRTFPHRDAGRGRHRETDDERRDKLNRASSLLAD